VTLALTAALLIAQAGAAQAAAPTVQEDRLALCRQEARVDPATAMVTASLWLAESQGPGRSAPQQCLGFAYTSLLRWDAAESAFLAARQALLPGEHAARARLAGMAGNAALAGNRNEAALAAFDLARQDAQAAGDLVLAGSVEADRARALVALGRLNQAAEALARARQDAPQDASAWLLSATLSRRQERLDEALGQIRTAAALAPDDPAIGLEAGLIAALSGQDEAAETSWRAVLASSPDSPEASVARDYLAQLAPPAELGR
jgi:tetratricopeptide (TPR) repeat protein